jgi:hypothetical protein
MQLAEVSIEYQNECGGNERLELDNVPLHAKYIFVSSCIDEQNLCSASYVNMKCFAKIFFYVNSSKM